MESQRSQNFTDLLIMQNQNSGVYYDGYQGAQKFFLFYLLNN